LKLFPANLTMSTTSAAGSTSSSRSNSPAPGAPCGPPPSIATYVDVATAFAAIQEHAKANGYALFKRDIQPPAPKPTTRITYVCDRFGKPQASRNKEVDPSKKRKNTGSKKCDCKMKIALKRDDISGYWELSVVEGSHNHSASLASAHPAHRLAALDPIVTAKIDALAVSGLTVSQILTLLRKDYSTLLLNAKDITNIVQKARLHQLGGNTPIQWLLKVKYRTLYNMMLL
jgi:hypothetical protein